MSEDFKDIKDEEKDKLASEELEQGDSRSSEWRP